jgi:hypothetical protein
LRFANWDQKVRVEQSRANNSSGKFPYGVLMEKLPALPCKLHWRPRNPKRILRFAQDFGCGLPLISLGDSLTPAKRLNLELAKGFEPPTL